MGNQTSKQHKHGSKKNVHWKSAEPPQPPGKPYLLPGLPTDEPDVVTIKWNRPLNDNGSSIMGFIVEHRRTGSPHWVRACPQLVQFTELALSGLEPGWRYQFRVIAENAVGKSQPSEASDPLTVTLQRNAISAPRFTIELEDFSGIENEKVEFKVSVVGSPSPQLSWFKDGFEIFSSRRTKIVTENDSSTLIFYQASLTDEGEIKCTATNRAGYCFTKCNLTVEAPPKIRLPRQYEDGLIIEAEEVIRLKVGIAGRPTPTVIWTHNGEMLTSGGRYEITDSDKNSSLKIDNSSRSDRGEYNLRAINKLGEDNTSFLVTVTARPTPPGKVAVKILLGQTVTLSWAPPEDDGGCKIGNYIVEYFRVGWNVWLKAATCRSLAVTLNDMIEGSEYKFRVKAENPYGISEPGGESEVLFIPDPKRGINQPVKDGRHSMPNLEPPMPPVAPKRRNPSPSPSRNTLTAENVPQKTTADGTTQIRRSPIPHELNTKIFDDETIHRDMEYGASDDFYKLKEGPPSSPYEKGGGLEEKTRQLRAVKNNVKFNLPEDAKMKLVEEAIYENLKPHPDSKSLKANSESQTSGKRNYLDLSRAGSDAQSSIQNSSEFMLVLYPDKESKNSTKNDSFDLEMEEYFAPPPPLSQSAPELNVGMPDAPMMRYAVSSTELLYERAMARFYKAVEYEEMDNARKRSFSVEAEGRRRSFSFDPEGRRASLPTDTTDAAVTRQRINSLPDSDRMSVLKRRLSGETHNLHINIPPRHLFDVDELDSTQLNTIRNELNTPEMCLDRAPSPIPPMTAEEELSDDYTDSTESSADEEVPTRRSQTRSGDASTFHPRMLSPYRQPENSEAAAVLTKPLTPLPDPNFKPKPILKRPASADGRRTPSKPERRTLGQIFGRRSASPSPVPSPRSQRKSVEIDEIPRIIQPEDFTYSPEHHRKLAQQATAVAQEVPEITVEQPRQPEPEYEPEPEPEVYVRPRNEQAQRKLMERRQSSLEENHVMADFYGDIIKDHSVRPTKPKVPIYMDPDALKQLEIEDDETQDSGITSSTEMSPQSTLSRSFSPPIQQPPRGPSPLTIARRASELIKAPPIAATAENEPVFGRRLSETSKIRAATPITKDNLILPQKTAERLAANKSPSPQRNVIPNGSVLQKHDVQFSSNSSSIDDVQPRGRATSSKSGAVPKRRNQSQSRERDSSTIRTKNPMESSILSRREKSSSKTRNRSESKSPSMMNRKIILNRMGPKMVQKEATPPARTPTPSELQEQVQLQVKSSLAYGTDVSILIFATYVYFFKSAVLALPILLLLAYRQISDKLPDWMKRKKS